MYMGTCFKPRHNLFLNITKQFKHLNLNEHNGTLACLFWDHQHMLFWKLLAVNLFSHLGMRMYWKYFVLVCFYKYYFFIFLSYSASCCGYCSRLTEIICRYEQAAGSLSDLHISSFRMRSIFSFRIPPIAVPRRNVK